MDKMDVSSDDQENIDICVISTGDESITKEAIVQENLKHLEEHTRKKRIAQEFYYNRGKSVLLKKPKKPVRERLGRLNKEKQKLLLGITDMSVIPPKIRRRKNPSNNNNQNVGKVFRAQNRINKIRQEQYFQLQASNMLNVDSSDVTSEEGPADLVVEVQNPNTRRRFQIANHNKIIRLRRTLPQDQNDMFFQCNNPVGRFQIVLNPKIQSEIAEIQARTADSEKLSITYITPSITAKTLDWRFTEQS